MLDLSNNNGAVDFAKVYHAGHQRRIYLKCTEGVSFRDRTAPEYFHRASAAGLKVGFYHFARPSKNGPEAEAQFFLRNLPTGWLRRNNTTLRPCLDLEDPNEPPSVKVANWARDWILYVKNHTGLWPIIYGNTWYLDKCNFQPQQKVSLWLASYGRNDGQEHPFDIPPPWKEGDLGAHQYTSVARMPGVEGPVDLSHVIRPSLLDVRRWSR